MPHKTNTEAVSNLKTLGVSEAEALKAANAVRLLAEDPETSADIKAQATHVSRELIANAGNAQAREEAMKRAASLAGRA